MRLERDDQAAAERRARSGDHRGYLRRVVTVVVHDDHATGLTVAFEPSLGAMKPREGVGDAREVQADALTDRDRGQRILQVVTAGHGELETAERLHDVVRPPMHLTASTKRTELDVGADDLRARVIETVGH